MKSLPVWLLVPALGAAALAAGTVDVMEPGEDTPTITIYTHFEQPHSKASVAGMKDEVGAIMRPAGLNVEWRSLDAARGQESAEELVVVTFKGRCRMEELTPFPGRPGALGSTHVSDGAVLPFTDIHCDRIRRLIGPRTNSEDVKTRQNLFGRAMGRVLAHELYHVIAKTTAHASGGLAKAFYSTSDLMAKKLEFRKKEAATLRHLKLHSLAIAAGTAAPQSGAQ